MHAGRHSLVRSRSFGEHELMLCCSTVDVCCFQSSCLMLASYRQRSMHRLIEVVLLRKDADSPFLCGMSIIDIELFALLRCIAIV